jgi:Protein of unknown function (DUF3179)
MTMTYIVKGYYRRIGCALALAVGLAWTVAAHASGRAGDELEKEYRSASIRAVARDAFPVLFNPPMGTVADGDKVIRPNEWVIGITINGQTKAYPVAVMGYHELINDHVGGHPITVCW